jgi:peptide/nickel transport system substrate-binding protein
VVVEVEKEVVKEVEVIKEVVKEVVKEVEVPVEKEVIKEVEKEVVVTVVATPTPAPKAVEAKVRTLKISIDPVFTETNLIWETHPSEHANQARHWMDPLVEMDPFTGKMVPGLATEWEILTPDAKNWLVKLREDVPFHKGWGEFTAKDVVFTHIMIAQEGGVSLDTGVWQRLAGTTEPVTEETAGSAAIVADVADNFKIIDDHTLEFNLNEKTPDLDYIMSARLGTTFMMSQDYFDAEGLKGYRALPIGTGSWQYVGRELSQFLELERVENHWERTPDFRGLRLNWVKEPSTRLAQLLTGEVQMATMDRSLYGQATSKGMVIYTSSAPANEVVIGFGGFYLESSPHYKPDVPFLDKRVREAINRALDRDEINREIFGGAGEPLYVQGFHASQPGWNPDWENNFERDYGYDPDKATALIKEAFPNGFKTQSLVTDLAQLPEMGELGLAMSIYLEPIGIEVEILELEFAAFLPLFLEGRQHNIISNLPASLHPPQNNINVFNRAIGSPGAVVAYSETQFIEDKMDEFNDTLDPVKRDALLREMGQHKYDEYVEVPLFWLLGEIVANPDIVADHHFSGGIAGTFTHWEYAEAVPK